MLRMHTTRALRLRFSSLRGTGRARGLGLKGRTALTRLALRAGVGLARIAQSLVERGVPAQEVALPEPLRVREASFNIVEDLIEYTRLPPSTVAALVRRGLDDFRREWHLTPEPLRGDNWYYLSSRMYLFANAVHVHETPELLDRLGAFVHPGARVLDFGGGTGNLALGLAVLGFQVDYIELSALQTDFTRFRVQKHGLTERLAVLDWWNLLPRGEYDLICAFDVLEHVSDLRTTITDVLLPALRPGAVLAEQSPFGADDWNPMHHGDPGLDALLREHGLERLRGAGGVRYWRSPP